jgi:hypothetical protein
MSLPTASEYFTKRLDAHLRTLNSDAAKRVFLTAEHERWQTRYREFVATEGARQGQPSQHYSQPQAVDFHLVLADITERLSALSMREAA